jgi:uncharacterized repeat protein (TIGR02059 family)
MAAFTILSFTTLSNAQDPGFFLDDWEEKIAIIPDSLNIGKTVEAPTVTIQVDAGQVIAKVPRYIYGNNAVTWDDGLRKNTTAMTDLINLDPHVLRWPGGNLSNSYFWNRAYGDRPTDIPEDINPWYGMQCPDWQMSLDEYYWLLEQTNSTGSVCVNYDYARYGTGPDPVATAAHMAAEWVRYDNGRSKYWEIGNENFGSWIPGYQIDTSLNQDGQPEFVNGQLYGQHCRIFIDSMRAAATEIGVEIKIGVVAFDAETSHDPIQTVWNEGMMPEVGDLADFLIVHNYFTPYNQDSPAEIVLNSHPVAGEIMAAQVADMAEAGKPMIPVAFTEWNIFAEGSMQQVSFVNGMHAALLLGEFIQNQYGMANRWDLVNGWSDGNDHGMFSKGGEPGVDPYNPRPAFFYMYYFQHYFGDRMVENTITGNNEVVAYSSSFTSGETGLVIINKGTGTETVQVELEQVDYGAHYYTHTLTGGTDNGDFSRKVFVNGIGTDEEGGGPDEYELIKAFAYQTEGGIKVDLPPRSVVYLMVEQQPPPMFVSAKVESDPSVVEVELSDEVLLAGDPSGFQVTFNETTPVAVTGTELDLVTSHILYLTLGQAVQTEDQVTLSYDGTDILSTDSIPLDPFAEELVENLLPGAPPQITEVATNSDGTLIQLSFNKQMQVTAPAEGDFTLVATGEPDQGIEITSAEVSETDARDLMLTPAENLYGDYTYLLSYDGSAISALDGTPLESFDSLTVTNLAAGMPPTFASAEVVNYGFQIRAYFDKPMSELAPYDSLFTVQVGSLYFDIDTIESGGDSMVISLEEYIRAGESVTLNYQGNAVTSADGGVLQPVKDFPVDNWLPRPTIFEISGTIDAELFTINMGMVLEPCSDEGGGYNLGYIDPGDWVEYEINVAETGIYSGMIRVAGASAAGQLVIQTPDGEEMDQATVTTPVTGGWQQWSSVPVKIKLNAGRQRLRISALTGNFNLNWLSLDYSGPLQASFVGAATNGTGDTVFVEFDKTMVTPPGKNPAGLTLTGDGNPYQVASVSWSVIAPNTLLLRLLSPLTAGLEQITLSYQGGELIDADEQPVLPFASQPVDNQIITSAVEELHQDIQIYPNPFGEVLYIEIPGTHVDRMQVRILDITGKTVLFEEITNLPGNSSVDLNVESLKEGLYLIRITCDDRMFHGSVVKR